MPVFVYVCAGENACLKGIGSSSYPKVGFIKVTDFLFWPRKRVPRKRVKNKAKFFLCALNGPHYVAAQKNMWDKNNNGGNIKDKIQKRG